MTPKCHSPQSIGPFIGRTGYLEMVLNWYHFLIGQWQNMDKPLDGAAIGISIVLMHSNMNGFFKQLMLDE